MKSACRYVMLACLCVIYDVSPAEMISKQDRQNEAPDPRLLEFLGIQKELESLGVDLDFLINERLTESRKMSAEEHK